MLILHHFEPMWDNDLRKKGIRGGFDQYQEMVIDHLGEAFDDQLLITRFEDHHIDDSYFQWFHGQCPKVKEYGFGWDHELVMNDEHGEYISGGNHSEYVQIADWMHDLPSEVKIAGCFDGECIEDLEIALRHLEIKFTRINKLIV